MRPAENRSVPEGLPGPNPLADEALGREVLTQSIPELRSGEWRLRSWRTTRVLEQRRKRIIFLTQAYETAAAHGPRTREIVAKVYAGRDGSRAFASMQQFWEAGFRPPNECRVPRPYAYSAEHNILFQAKAQGSMWVNLLHVDGQPRAGVSAGAAAWLVQFQSCPLQHGVANTQPEHHLVQRHAEGLTAVFPEHAARLMVLAQRLSTLLDGEEPALAPSHGGYHPLNVLATSRLTTVIDFDKFGRREAAYDVGYAIGRLLILSHFRPGDVGPGARAALAFWRRYERGGQASWRRIKLQVARFLLQSLHFEVCEASNNRVELLEHRAALVDQWLASDGPAVLVNLAGEPEYMVNQA